MHTKRHPLAGKRGQGRPLTPGHDNYEAARRLNALRTLLRDLHSTYVTMTVEGEHNVALEFERTMSALAEAAAQQMQKAGKAQMGFGGMVWEDTLRYLQPYLDEHGLVVVNDPDDMAWPPACFDFEDERCAYATYDSMA